jgi:hypothetical protein
VIYLLPDARSYGCFCFLGLIYKTQFKPKIRKKLEYVSETLNYNKSKDGSN